MSMYLARRRRAALLLAPVLAAGSLLVAAGSATAHVSASSADATRGGWGKVTFRVPNESDTVATTQVVVTLPVDQPFAHLTAGAKPGWTVQSRTEPLPKPVDTGSATLTEAVRTVTWTATGDGIGVGQFDEFALSGGPFPDAEEMTFSARQVYADGKVVDWDQVADGDAEPQRPAPALVLSAGETGRGHGAAVAGDGADDDDEVARTVAALAVLVAAGSLLVAFRQTRRRG